MQENEFEKQVRHKMDGFRLRPSDPVWLNIREEFREKRRRRLLFIPLFAMLLVAGYFSWKYYLAPGSNTTSLSKNQPAIDHKTTEKITSETRNNNKISNTEEEKLNNPLSTKRSSAPAKEATEKKNDVSVYHKENNTAAEKSTNHNDKRIKTAGNNVPVHKQYTVRRQQPGKQDLAAEPHKKDITAQQQETNLPANKSGARYTGAGQPKSETTKMVTAGESADAIVYPDNSPVSISRDMSAIHLSTDSIKSRTLADVQVPALKSSVVSRSTSDLKVGFVFSTGLSTRQEKLFQLSSVPGEDKSIVPAAPYVINAFTNAGRGVLILQPSAVKAGLAFKAGVMAMKQLSKRFDVSAGVQYSYSSDHIEIGSPINTSSYLAAIDVQAVAYNAATNSASSKRIDYTNKYHFIELPLAVYFNVTPKWKTPFVWNAGVSVSRLISSNVLLYDAALGGVYYEGNKDLNKTQVGVSTGFAFRFGTNKRLQWSVGPEIYMNTTKLFQSTYDKNNRPVYGGLNVQVLFPAGKKKRSSLF